MNQSLTLLIYKNVVLKFIETETETFGQLPGLVNMLNHSSASWILILMYVLSITRFTCFLYVDYVQILFRCF